MIDIHCAIPDWLNKVWVAQCIDSLKDEPIRLHIIDPVVGDIGRKYQRGFRCGVSEYVGWVDPDDFIVPGIYQKLLYAVNGKTFAWANEEIWDINPVTLQPLRTHLEKRAHTIHIIHRDTFNIEDVPELFGKDDRSKKFITNLSKTGTHVDEVGYIRRNWNSWSKWQKYD